MTGHSWVDAVIAAGSGLLLSWLLLVGALAWRRPRGPLLQEALGLLPDLLRLLRRLAADRDAPLGSRVKVGLLLVYLAVPIDLIPDFIPVLGYADDAILVSLVLRSVVRHAGLDTVRRHGSGSDDGLAAVQRLTGLSG
jgi:uncharacterized membrane protein YkvA (DUF1232 family)